MRFSCAFALILSLFFGVHAITFAQTTTAEDNTPAHSNPVVRLSAQDTSHFENALAALAQQGNIGFVCEDQPLNPDVAEAENNKQVFASLQSAIPLNKAIQKVAELYDYEAVRVSNTLVLFKKLYSSDEDIPNVNLAEALRSLDNLVYATQYFDVEDSTASLRNLYVSLSQKQRPIITEQGIPFAELTPTQQQLARKVAYSFQFGGRNGVENMAMLLRAFQSRKVNLKLRSQFNMEIPYYSGTFPYNGLFPTGKRLLYGKADLGISYWLRPVAGVTLYEVPKEAISSGRDIRADAVEPTTPQKNDTTGLPKRRIAIRSLSSIVADTGSYAKGEKATFQIDPIISDKPVFVAGTDKLSAIEIVQAIADIYGLKKSHIVKQGQSVYLISPPTPYLLTEAQAVRREIERLIPAPLWRAYSKTQLRKHQSDTDKKLVIPAYLPLHGADGLYITTVRRLRALIEPALRNSAPEGIFVTQLGTEEKRLIAVSQLLLLFNEPHFREMLDPVPDFVTNVEGNTYWLTVKDAGRTMDYRFGSRNNGSYIAGQDGVFPPIIDNDEAQPMELPFTVP